MDNNKLVKQNGFTLSENNPFRGDLEKMMANAKTVTRTEEINGGMITERLTMVFEKQYLPQGFTKLSKNKELAELSAYACKILVHIAINMGYEAERIQLSGRIVGMNQRTYSKAMVELLSQRVIVRDTANWYWINVTLLVVGKLKMHKPQE